MPFASFRKASQKVQFHFPRSGQVIRSIGDEWLCFTNDEKFTNESLGYLADTFPMLVEQFREDNNPYDVSSSGTQSRLTKPAKYWYPTLVLNLDIKKALPEGGVDWLFGRVRVKQIKNGRMDLEVIIMDEGGDIVALSNHVCLVLGSERNTAARSHYRGKL
jgi:Thioesterase-like superfamily